MRRLSSLVLLLTLTPLPAASRNVVLLIADDLGLTLGCYGDKCAKTPNLDALAKSGTRFTHAFAAVASCSPSRSTIYTGMQTHTNGQYGLAHATHNFHTRPGVKSLPGYLKAAGYHTGIIGKNHVLPQSVYPWDEEIRASGRNGAEMAKLAQKFIEARGDMPFCLVLGYTDPHRAQKGFANEATYPGLGRVPVSPKDVSVPAHLPDTPAVRADLADYYEAVHRLDEGVGRLVEVLKATGRDKDTLVIFLSDNGIPFPGAKTTVYDAGIRLPLFVVNPTRKKVAVTSAAMVSWIDVLPTILDWAGVKKPAVVQGRSLLPILEDERPMGWDEVYASHSFHEVTMYYPCRAIRTRQHKYIRNLAHPLDFPFASDLYHSPTWQGILKAKDDKMGARTVRQFVRRPKEELYDVVADPVEAKNLAGDPAHAKTLADLRARVRAWQQATGDPWLVKDEYE